jgi:hypothetical protein
MLRKWCRQSVIINFAGALVFSTTQPTTQHSPSPQHSPREFGNWAPHFLLEVAMAKNIHHNDQRLRAKVRVVP